MFRLERILVPIDFSETSLSAVEHAAALARRFGSHITLLHVNEFQVLHSAAGALGFGITSVESARAEHLAARRKQLDALGAGELSGVPVERIVACGDPAKLIVERARAEESDLILMPTHGGGLFRRFLLGSVTAKVLHDAGCPVWTGAHLDEPPALTPGEIRHVMCALNFRPHSSQTLEWAAAFAQKTNAKLTVIHAVLETPPNLPDRYMFQWREEAHGGAAQRIHVLLQDSAVPADALVVGDGDVPAALAQAIQDRGAGLLVIGRGDGGESGGRLGPHTYGIICRVPCPVVSI
jgi:nucleotide-binding universal stress UspA family protein